MCAFQYIRSSQCVIAHAGRWHVRRSHHAFASLVLPREPSCKGESWSSRSVHALRATRSSVSRLKHRALRVGREESHTGAPRREGGQGHDAETPRPTQRSRAPRTHALQCTAQRSPDGPTSKLKGTRALLVEDNEINRELALDLLMSWCVSAHPIAHPQLPMCPHAVQNSHPSFWMSVAFPHSGHRAPARGRVVVVPSAGGAGGCRMPISCTG
jgi:hypothetical protein